MPWCLLVGFERPKHPRGILAKAVLMANLSSCDPEVLSEYSEQTHVDDFQDNEIHSGSNIIPYSQYLQESQDAVIQDTNPFAPNDLLVLCLVEQMTDHVAHLDKENQTNKMVNESLTAELERYKVRIAFFEQRLNVDLNKKEKLIDSQMDDLIRDRNAKLAAFQQEIDTLNETLSNNLNKIKEDFGKRFVTKKELSAEQAFWLKYSSLSETSVKSHTPVRNEALSKLPKMKMTEVQEQFFNQMEAAVDNVLKLKGLNVVNTAISKPNATIAPGMFKLDIEPISPRLKNNRDAHETDSLKTKDYNKPLLTSTRVKPTTSASGSKPSGNTKNNRITRPPHSNQKNKVEDHSRKVKSSLNKTNSIYEPISNALVKHSMRNAKFEYICAICNKCLFDGNHDMCLIDFVNDVNVRSKSKSKRNKMRKAWKPTGKLFTNVGYKWKPTRRFFTIVNNSCPLTNITPKKTVHLKETTPKSAKISKPEIKVYSRRPKQLKSVVCALGKSKKSSHQPKAKDTNQEKLYLLHMDICGPMRVESINGKKSKDEAPDAIIKCIKNIQVRLNAIVHNVRTDNGIEYVNQTLRDFYENVSILHQTSVARTPQ
ncbi:retrovirus-related pol polyprotein from transposon TNT 1-94 [Tanacetum coccineum]